MTVDANGAAPPRWLSPRKAAARLDVSIAEIRKLIRDGRLRARRVRGSRMLRIAVEDLDALLEPVGREAVEA
jgi:excisionase family DNA binding protein